MYLADLFCLNFSQPDGWEHREQSTMALSLLSKLYIDIDIFAIKNFNFWALSEKPPSLRLRRSKSNSWSHYIKQLELILSKIHRPNNRHFSFGDCDTSLAFLRHDELQIWGLGTVGALAIRANGFKNLGHRGTSSFQPTSQPARQSNSKPTDWPFCQPAKLSNTTCPR